MTDIPSRTVTLHPDKIAAPEARPAAEARFVHLKLARDILIDPAKRFAYDRFGPDMLLWQHCITVRDYVTAGTYSIAPFYVGSAMFMIILTVLGYMDWGRYVSGPLESGPALGRLHSDLG